MPVQFQGRREDRRLITGEGRYTSDWNLSGQVHAAFLRADRAHARIRALDTAAARAMPGVLDVYTARDIASAGFRNPPTLVGYPGRAGYSIKVPHRTMLATERVRYVGEEVAMVVAHTPLAAADAADAIVVDYEDLPAVAHQEDAARAGAPQIYPDIPGNLSFDYDYGDESGTAAAISRAHHVTRLSIDSQRVIGQPMEPRAALVAYSAGTDRYDLYVPNQGTSMMRAGLAGIVGLPPEKLRIFSHDVGGGFGIRSTPYCEYPLLMFAAKRLGRPVKWVSTRSETSATDYHGRAIGIEGELALDREGNFLAIRVHWLCDQGAYLSAPGPLINTKNGQLTLCGVYRIPVGFGRHRLMLTNTTPITAYRGAGRPDAAYIVERLVDRAARETGIDRIELRRRNLIPAAAFPYKTASGSTYDSGDFAALVAKAREASDWDGFEARRSAAAERGRLRGIGCATFIEPSGGGMAPKDQVRLEFDGDANVRIASVAQPHGQGHETVFPALVASILGLPAEKVSLCIGDPDAVEGLIGNGVIGSRSAMALGGASRLAALEAVAKGLQLAARKLEAAPDDIEFKDGAYFIQGTGRNVSLASLAREHADARPHPLDSVGEVPIAVSFPSGAHVAEVEIDPATGVTRLVSYVAVDDCGSVLDHTLVEGQLHGALMQGIGQVFLEHAVYDRASGQLLTASFMDYGMPKAGMLCNVRGFEVNVPSPTNPLGAKGVGEAGTTGALPTVVNAVLDALAPLGIESLDMPLTPARVWAAIQSAQQRQSPSKR